MCVNDILKAFISGTCFPIYLPFFWGFYRLKPHYNIENMKSIINMKDPYHMYTILMPIYFGVMSILAILLSYYYKINIRLSFLIISIISTINISLFITQNNVFKFTDSRYKLQYFYLLIFHFITYNILIANIFIFLKN